MQLHGDQLMLRHCTAWLLLLILGTSSLSLRAENLILSRAALEDPSRTLTLSQVQSKTFSPLNDMLSQGYSKSVYWVRLEVAPPPLGGPVRLRVVPSLLDDIRLFEPAPDRSQEWRQHISGDTHPFESGDRSLFSLGFLVQPAAPYTTYYLRVDTSSSVLAEIQALTPAASRLKDATFSLIQMGYFAFMGFVLLWGIKSYHQHPDRITGFFIAHQLINVFMIAAFFGSFAPFAPESYPGLVNKMTNYSLFLNGLLGALFHRQFLRLLHLPQLGMRALGVVAGSFLVVASVYTAGWEHEALHANAWAHLALGGLMFAFAFAVKPMTTPNVLVVRVTYSLLGLALMAQMLTGLGWLPGDRRTMLGIPLFFALSAGLMLHLLSARAQQLAAVAEQKVKAGEMAMQQLELEKQYAAEQERFTDMLTHELKTPLSIAFMSLGALRSSNPYLDRIRQALSNMNDIVDRARLVELVRNKRLPVQIESVNVSERTYECIEASKAPERIKASVACELAAETDSKLLGIIMGNLIDNALKYSPPAETVELQLQRLNKEKPGIALVVKNGVGVAGVPDPTQVFSKYYRSSGAHNKTGSGLGLHLCKHLAGMIGASLTYKSTDNTVEFELWLPA